MSYSKIYGKPSLAGLWSLARGERATEPRKTLGADAVLQLWCLFLIQQMPVDLLTFCTVGTHS